MRRILFSLSLLFSSLIIFSGTVAAQGQYVSGSTGIDVSWPNCKNSIPNVAFGVVGVNDGTGYSANPCFSNQASHFSNNLSLYVNTGWDAKSIFVNPNSPNVCAAGDNNCLAYNYGYNAGVYAYKQAAIKGMHSSTWWMDVESNGTWNSNIAQNQNSLTGEHDALADNGITAIGVYSTTYQWDTITGTWKNLWPSWGATTWTSAKQAKTFCTGHEFTGGPSYLMQYQSLRSKLDQDVAC